MVHVLGFPTLQFKKHEQFEETLLKPNIVAFEAACTK